MITKIIACSDIHIPSYKGIEDLKVIMGRFLDEVKTVVEEEGKDSVRVVVAGDVFHNKISITNESILAASWFFGELNSLCKTIVIAGNHDMLMNNLDRVDSLTSLFELTSYENVIYLDKALGYKSGLLEDDNVLWCLYSSFEGFNPPDVKSALMKYDRRMTVVGLIHADINGAMTATGYMTDNALDGDIFQGCDLVIAGHIHKQQELRKNGVPIVYCSSINQKDFGESIFGHGYVLWDLTGDEPEYEFVNIDNSEGGFYKFSVNSLEDLDNDNEELINLQ